MRKCCFILSLCFVSGLAMAQKTIYDPNAVVRDAKGYNAINVSGGIDLYISYGDEAIAVSASETKYRDKIKTTVENGVLKIWYDDNKFSWNSGKDLKAYVSFKTLRSLNASGGSDIIVEGSIKSDQLKIDISGGCDFKGRVDVNELNVDQSGGSDVSINGRAEKVFINASGGSDFNGYNLITDYCEAEASGGSDVEITANKEISARASGASDISYKGNAALKESKASGASSVSKHS
jgi:hypothetical protein